MHTWLQLLGLIAFAVGVGSRFGVDAGVMVAGVESVALGVALERERRGGG